MSFRSFAFFGLVVLLLVALPLAAFATEEDFSLVAENEYLKLYARAQDGQLIVEQVGTGLTWASNPDPDTIEDYDFLSNSWQGNLISPVYFEYFDSKRNVRGGNVYTDEAEIEYHALENGYGMTYFFPKQEIGFTVQFLLDGDSLLVQIPWETVAVGDTLRLLSIRVLPFLDAQTSTVDLSGYMVVPDGSGGIIRFNEEAPLSQSGFSEWIYGPDPASAQTQYDPYRQPVIMPIFGMRARDQGFLGIIEEGQEAARVVATPSGVITELNWITSEVFYSQAVMMRTSRQGGGIRVYDEQPFPGDRSVRYYFFGPETADYVGMAQRYRDYLMDKRGAERINDQTKEAPFLIRFFGADYEAGSFGKIIKPMTSFEDAGEIVKSLRANGIDDLWVSFLGWQNQGINGNLPKRLPAEKSLGGNDGLASLALDLKSQEIPFILEDNYTIARGKRNGFTPTSQASRTTFNDIVRVTSRHQAASTTTYVINPAISLKFGERDIPKIRELGVEGLLFKAIGETLYSDHNPQNKVHRNVTSQIYRSFIELGKEKVGMVGVERGNAYTIGMVDFITDVPLQSTRDIVIDESIPFWQIAVHGLVKYFAEPINMVTNPQRYILNTLEYGALPSIILTAEPSWHLRHTQSSYLYSTMYDDWLEEIVRQYAMVNKNLAPLHDQFIVGHAKLSNNVYQTIYENGISIVVNYGSRSFIFGDKQVEPRSFIIIGGEGAK